MLTKLELLNFQKHAHLEIDFTSGVNIIFGQTDAGKSCIRRALSWVFFNEPKGDVVRKTGTKKTSAKVTLDNGAQVERIKSSSANAYILYVNDEEKRFDAIGKGIPEEVLKILKAVPIIVDGEKLNLNIADQIALPFLLDKPATFRSKLFNKLTGSDIVDKALQDLNKDILRIGREEKIEKENVEEKAKRLEELDKEKIRVEKTYNKASEIFVGLKEKQEKYSQLKTYLEKLNNIKNELEKIDDNLKDIKLIDNQVFIDLESKIDKLNIYSQLLNDLSNNKRNLESTNKELSQLKIPDIDTKILNDKIDRFNKLNEIKLKLEDIQKLNKKASGDIGQMEESINKGQIEYKEILKKFGKCPVCKNVITNKCLEGIKL